MPTMIILFRFCFFQMFFFSYSGFQSFVFEEFYQKHVVRTKLYIYVYYLCYLRTMCFCCSQKLLSYFSFQCFVFKCIYQKHIVRTQLYIYVYYLYCLSHMVLRCYQILLNMLVFNMLFLSVHSINISCVLNYISTFLLQSRLKVNCMRDWRNHFSIISN